MTDSTPSWADGDQPTTTSSATDPAPSPAAPDVPPMPAAPPAANTAAGKSSTRRTLTTLLIGAVAGAAIVGGTWYTTSRDTGSSSVTVDGKPVAGPPGTFTLKGEFVLTDGAVDDGIGGCEGSGGYEDIALGTSVTVYDAAGAVIATSALVLSEFDRAAGTCTYDVDVPRVPSGQDFYQVEISHRGKIQLTADEAKGGSFSGSLG